MKAALVFVYNANSGLFNTLTDMAHKIFSPATYSCNLCFLTHSNFGMRQEWKDFINSLNRPVEFLHADELNEKYRIEIEALPAVLKKEDERLQVLIDRDALNACRTMDELKQLIEDRLSDDV